MNQSSSSQFHYLIVLGVLCVVGCGPVEEISVYTIPTTIPDSLVRRDRMLGAIVPSGNNVWFYKVVADTDDVEKIQSQFKEWVKTLAYEDDEPILKPRQSWERVSPGMMQHAKFEIPVDEAMIQMSVSRLGKNGTWDQQIAVNVNRWRDQMGLESVESQWAGAEELEIANPDSTDPAMWVAIDGVFKSRGPMGGGSPPMAGGGIAQNAPTRQQGRAAPLDLRFDMPTGWTEGRSGGMRLAAFNVAGDVGAAEVTVIEAGGDIRQNIAMWLSQVKPDSKPEDAVEELVKGSESITVIGKPGTRFRLFGSESNDKAIDVTVIPLESGSSLFIKMTGDRKTVKQSDQAFTKFLASIKTSDSDTKL